MVDSKQARRASRILALKVVFAYLLRDGRVSLSDCFKQVLRDIDGTAKDDFALELCESVAVNIGKIKVVIRALAPEFELDKIAPINRALLILGLVEMKFIDTPPVVVINEYIELAKEFGEDKSAGFVNGVLDAYRKSLGLDRKK